MEGWMLNLRVYFLEVVLEVETAGGEVAVGALEDVAVAGGDCFGGGLGPIVGKVKFMFGFMVFKIIGVIYDFYI
jgi:hypothetical protein